MTEAQRENAERAMMFWLSDVGDLKRLVKDALYELDCICDECDDDTAYRIKLEAVEATAGHIARAARKRLDEVYGL